MLKKSIVFVIISFLFISSSISEKEDNGRKKTNIILMIGDGMGVAQVYAAILNNGSMNVEKMPYSGFSKTYSASNKVTDSGAGGTAIATGIKTYNGAIGVGVDSLPVKSILEIAENNGLSTGLVSTSSITHATPASFIAHQKSRSFYEDIAADFLKTDIDVFIGGGKKFFATRKDSVDLTKDLKLKGYSVVFDTISLKKASGKVAALLADEHLPRSYERKNTLPLSVEKAISLLNTNDKGFFLMVEGSQIDWACHNNDPDYLIGELTDFDKAIGKALEFAKKDGNTLVIVTADHETGGLFIQNDENGSDSFSLVFSSKSKSGNDYQHTGVMVPVFAYGLGADKFTGIFENTELFSKMVDVYNFKKE